MVEISFPVSEIVCGTFQVLGFSAVSLVFLLVFQVLDRTRKSNCSNQSHYPEFPHQQQSKAIRCLHLMHSKRKEIQEWNMNLYFYLNLKGSWSGNKVAELHVASVLSYLPTPACICQRELQEDWSWHKTQMKCKIIKEKDCKDAQPGLNKNRWNYIINKILEYHILFVDSVWSNKENKEPQKFTC